MKRHVNTFRRSDSTLKRALVMTTVLVCFGLTRASTADEKSALGSGVLGPQQSRDALLADWPSEPEARWSRIETLAREKLTGNIPITEWLDLAEMVGEAQQELLADLAEDDHRIVQWGCEYAQILLGEVLPTRDRADIFGAWGFPDEAQRQVISLVHRQVTFSLNHARRCWVRLPRRLRAREDFTTRYINSGLWDELRELGDHRLPYLRSLSAVMHVMPARHHALGVVPVELEPPALDEPFMQQVAADEATLRFIAEEMTGDSAARCLLLAGQLSLIQRLADRAGEAFAQVHRIPDAAPLTQLEAQVARITALRQSDRFDAAEQLLIQVRSGKSLADQPLYHIVLADQHVMIERARLAQPTGGMRRGGRWIIEPYQSLLNDRAIDPWLVAIERFVLRRLAEVARSVASSNELPPLVEVAQAAAMLGPGAAVEGSDDIPPALAEEAIAALDSVFAREPLHTTTRRAALFYRAEACREAGRAVEAIETDLALAEASSQSTRGEVAMRRALDVAAEAWQRRDGADVYSELASLYERALRLLIEQYDSGALASVAKHQRYQLALLLRQRGRFAEALEAYGKVPADHPRYLDAQYERLICLSELTDQGAVAQRSELTSELLHAEGEFVDRIEQELGRALAPHRAEQLRYYLASARLLRAEMVMDAAGEPDEALTLVEAIDSDHSALRSRIMRLRISAYQRQSRWADAVALIERIERDSPQDIGPIVLGVLRSLNEQIDNARMVRQPQRVRELGGFAVELAERLVDWSLTQPTVADDPQRHLAIQVTLPNALLAAGDYERAAKQFEQLHATPAGRNSLAVVEGLAEAYFHLGPDHHAKAAPLYAAIIRSFTANDRPRSDSFWLAQLRSYQMADEAAEARDRRIFAGIARLQHDYPQLGGEPYRSALQGLLMRHAPR